ncbi:hypothetical protein [Streptomyces bacillaris]|uniref:hypothetical protein n=1 Tax=Streptomyces bacillaris TaxID=68179 RepID=UPI003814474E
MDSGWMAVWPVAAFFLGGIAAQLTAFLNHRRQRAERAEDAEAGLRSRREEFELVHLVDVNQLLRKATEAARQLDTAVKLYGARKRDGILTAEDEQELADGLTDFRDAVDAVDAQLGFVLADEVRGSAVAAREALDNTFARLVTDQPVSWRPFELAMAGAYEALSARVRAIYAGQAAGGTSGG